MVLTIHVCSTIFINPLNNSLQPTGNYILDILIMYHYIISD